MGDASPKKSASKKPAPAHPKYSEMVTTAIAALKERSGSSTQAIKKYIMANYPVNPSIVKSRVKMVIKNNVANGTFIQVTGTGASGSFKLSEKAKKKPAPKKPTKKPTAKKPTAKKTPTKKPAKKSTPKKKPAKKPAAKKTTGKKAGKTPKKNAKKPTKKPAKKTPSKKKAPSKKTAKK